MNFDMKSALIALKHHGKRLSRKEMKKLQHVLNGNSMAAALGAAVLLGFTYLMRRNQVAIVTPHWAGDTIICATTHITAPTPEMIAEENHDAEVVAATLGGNLATVITDLQTQNENFQIQLAEQNEEFQRTLAQ